MDFSPTKLQFYNFHKSFGLLVLLLFFVRIIWHLKIAKPKSLTTHKPWEQALSKIIHFNLYGLLLFLPLSGWIMSSAGDFNIKFFGVNMPDIAPKDEKLFMLSNEAHEVLGWVLLVALALHIVGALKHHIIDRDVTMERMSWQNIRGVTIGGIICLVLGVYGFVTYGNWQKISSQYVASQKEVHSVNDMPEQGLDLAINAPRWVIDHDKSHIMFEATQYGQSFTGSFRFDGDIYFSADKLDQSKVRIEIDIRSIKTGSLDRDQQAKSFDWFDTDNYPKAFFESSSFSKGLNVEDYIAKGTLTVRGVTLPIEIPFSLSFQEKEEGGTYATMHARFDLNRLDYKVGQGQWAIEDAVSNKVSLTIDLNASKN